MPIGETLAQARHQAGLTVAEVSQQTRIRETLIRNIEEDDYSELGGDFYARGHIRAIAKVVGAVPGTRMASGCLPRPGRPRARLAGSAPLPGSRTGPAGASARRVPRRQAVRPG